MIVSDESDSAKFPFARISLPQAIDRSALRELKPKKILLPNSFSKRGPQ